MYKFSVRDEGIVLQLRARLVAWAAVEDDRAYLLGAYNTQVSNVAGALERLLDALATEANSRSATGCADQRKINPDVLRNFQELIYRLAEAYEFLRGLSKNTDAKGTNKSAARKCETVIRGASRADCLICNKIKHDNYFLGRVDNLYNAGFYAEGFALLSRGRKGSIKICPDLHDKNKPGLSFNLGLRSLLFEFLQADVAAERLCSELGAGEFEPSLPHFLSALRCLNSRPEIGLRFERAQSIRTMWEQSGEYLVGVRKRDLPYLGNKVQVIQEITGDGYSKEFPILG